MLGCPGTCPGTAFGSLVQALTSGAGALDHHSAQVVRAGYLRSVLFSQVLDSEWREAVNAVSTKPSNTLWTSSLLSFHQHDCHWDTTGCANGMENQAASHPLYLGWACPPRLSSEAGDGVNEGRLLQTRA